MTTWFICGLVGVIGLLVFMLAKCLRHENESKMELLLVKEELQNVKKVAAFRLEQLQNKLNETEQLARVSIQTQNAVMLMNQKGDIIWVNESFTRLYEYTFSEFISTLGKNIRQTSFNPLIHERLDRCLKQKLPVTYEALNITKSGKEIWTHTSLIPLLDDNNEVVGMVTIDSDVHSRIKASEDMAKFIFSFNEKIMNLTTQLDDMVELTNELFERIEISQRRMNRTEQILAFNKDISDKIKILGINASIEAHSAGVKGNGFRVIANEVVSISNTMLVSLKEISELVSGVKRTSEKLGAEKQKSELAIQNHRDLLNQLKNEINSVEMLVRQME